MNARPSPSIGAFPASPFGGPDAPDAPKVLLKMFWHRSGKDPDVGLGYVNVEQDSANALGNLVPLIVPG